MLKAESGSCNDDQLVKLLKQGSRNGFAALYTKYFPKVFHTCYSYSRNHDDAFDLAQDAMIKAFSKIGTFEGTSTFSTWLFSITRNHCLSYISSRNKTVHEDVSLAYGLQADGSDAEEYEERLHMETMECEMSRYLSLLPSDDQRMLELKYHQNYSIKDLQKEFRLSASAVKMRLLRSRQKTELILNEDTILRRLAS
jgi:RNA polymerase sigma factor (sigma-70 family)